MDIELQTQLLRLKGFLNEANHITYTYSQLGRSNPSNLLTDDKAKQLIKAYRSLMDDIKSLVTSYEQSGLGENPPKNTR